jgi:hypothetical protein
VNGGCRGSIVLQGLANRTYRHLFLAQVLALIGTGLATMALGHVFDLAGAVLAAAWLWPAHDPDADAFVIDSHHPKWPNPS